MLHTYVTTYLPTYIPTMYLPGISTYLRRYIPTHLLMYLPQTSTQTLADLPVRLTSPPPNWCQKPHSSYKCSSGTEVARRAHMSEVYGSIPPPRHCFAECVATSLEILRLICSPVKRFIQIDLFNLLHISGLKIRRGYTHNFQ